MENRKHVLSYPFLCVGGPWASCLQARSADTSEIFFSASRTRIEGLTVTMLCDWLCWVCELSATLLSYSRLTLCHQPTGHSVMNILSGQWFLNESSPFLGHSFRCFSLKCGSTWKHQLQTIGWHAHAQRMYPMLTSHCDLPLLAAWIRSECPTFRGLILGASHRCLRPCWLIQCWMVCFLDSPGSPWPGAERTWGHSPQGLLWTCYEPAMNVRLNAGAELWLLEGTS